MKVQKYFMRTPMHGTPTAGLTVLTAEVLMPMVDVQENGTSYWSVYYAIYEVSK